MRTIVPARPDAGHGARPTVTRKSQLANSFFLMFRVMWTANGKVRKKEFVPSGSSASAGEDGQAAERLLEQFLALAEREADHGAALVRVVVVEDGARDGDHARPVG